MNLQSGSYRSYVNYRDFQDKGFRIYSADKREGAIRRCEGGRWLTKTQAFGAEYDANVWSCV
jgi:hypothetical protein